MGMRCSICFSRYIRQIDADLLDHHQSFSAIALRYNVGRQALWRHRHTHLARALRESAEVQNMLTADNLLEKLSSLDTTALELLTEARQAGDIKTALLAIRESRANLEVFSKIGVLADLSARLAAGEAMLESALAHPATNGAHADEQE